MEGMRVRVQGQTLPDDLDSNDLTGLEGHAQIDGSEQTPGIAKYQW